MKPDNQTPATDNENKKAKKHQTKPKKSLAKKLGNFFMSLLIIGFILLSVMAYILWQSVMSDTTLTAKAQVLNVRDGDTYYKLIDKWQAKGQVKYAPVAKLYTKAFIKKPLNSGAYDIPLGANIATVLKILSGGKQAQMVRVQIIEGKRSKDLLALLHQHEDIKKDIEILAIKKNLAKDRKISHTNINKYNDEIIKQLGIPIKHLEGWFAPDTYFFGKGTSDVTILKHLYKKQKQTLDTAWQNRAPNLPYKNAYEALIMASIIEKETGIPSERGKVAGVFVNRMRKGMKLQTDPTVIYGMGDNYKGNIRKKDLREKTRYNTYKINGLPPTPIALPSSASIKAALNPTKTDALFFVATGDGGHTFTKTYAQHQIAVKAYLKKLREKS